MEVWLCTNQLYDGVCVNPAFPIESQFSPVYANEERAVSLPHKSEFDFQKLR